jgi:hypothetical protein
LYPAESELHPAKALPTRFNLQFPYAMNDDSRKGFAVTDSRRFFNSEWMATDLILSEKQQQSLRALCAILTRQVSDMRLHPDPYSGSLWF